MIAINTVPNLCTTLQNWWTEGDPLLTWECKSGIHICLKRITSFDKRGRVQKNLAFSESLRPTLITLFKVAKNKTDFLQKGLLLQNVVLHNNSLLLYFKGNVGLLFRFVFVIHCVAPYTIAAGICVWASMRLVNGGWREVHWSYLCYVCCFLFSIITAQNRNHLVEF